MLKLTYSGKVLSKKNTKNIIKNPRTGKPMILSNRAARANESDMENQFRIQTLNLNAPISKCQIEIVIYEPNWQRRDLDNQATSILDALVRAEVIEDDSIKCVTDIKTTFGGVDCNNPRAEIKVKEVK